MSAGRMKPSVAADTSDGFRMVFQPFPRGKVPHGLYGVLRCTIGHVTPVQGGAP